MEQVDEGLCKRIENEPGLTAFQRRVYLALLEVPAGFVTTYGALAGRVGCRSARAVGGALRANPLAPAVPCHRVLTADGGIGGFCGKRSGAEIRRKIGLLRAEGAPVDADGRLLDRRRLWQF